MNFTGLAPLALAHPSAHATSIPFTSIFLKKEKKPSASSLKNAERISSPTPQVRAEDLPPYTFFAFERDSSSPAPPPPEYQPSHGPIMAADREIATGLKRVGL